MTIPYTTNKRVREFLPPESVPVHFTIATVSARFGAQLLDLLITVGSIWLLLLFVILLPFRLPENAVSILFILLLFLIRTPYYIFSELVWNGRTLGKRIVGIRVINSDGRRLTPHQITARNLMKELEVWIPFSYVFIVSLLPGLIIASPIRALIMFIWVMTALLIPLFNRRHQRLGDMIAGTLVVENPRSFLLDDLTLNDTAGSHEQKFDFQPENLVIYGRYELQTLEEILRGSINHMSAQALHELTLTIIGKTGYTQPVREGEEEEFLTAFYRAQREYLESGQLFGKFKENKYQTAGGAADKKLSFAFRSDQLAVYGSHQLQMLAKALRPPTSLAGQEQFYEIFATIKNKINYTGPVHSGEEHAFLTAYHNALQAYLQNGERV